MQELAQDMADVGLAAKGECQALKNPGGLQCLQITEAAMINLDCSWRQQHWASPSNKLITGQLNPQEASIQCGYNHGLVMHHLPIHWLQSYHRVSLHI